MHNWNYMKKLIHSFSAHSSVAHTALFYYNKPR